MVAPTSRPSSYYNRGLSIQANTPQQALGHGVTCACRESSEVSPHMSSEGVTTPMAVTRKSKFTDETDTCSSQSGSTAGSIREDLPLCPKDELCPRINNRKHQYKYAHTCRLFPCYHGHVVRHARLFRHVEGQIAQPAGFDASRMSVHTLASVNFSQISMEAPNAYRIYISHGDKSHEIFGDWASVKVHTFKRYLHQVYHIPPSSQKLLSVKSGKVLDDEIVSVKSYDIGEDAVLQLVDTSRASDHQMCRIPFDEL
ncbi:unnamed protein product [Phytomonas sp. EM1]|nr:unnamed protein product [Phytomonas sp. EM1]|eukprot:CCW65703.1 unnamed protein product [Phytomonas sp. isolate EM1]